MHVDLGERIYGATQGDKIMAQDNLDLQKRFCKIISESHGIPV